ncbi:EpsG family protein [Thermophilibacter sp.]
MIVLLANCALLVFEWMLICRRSPAQPEGTGRGTFCFVAGAQWVLLAGLRSISTGYDTNGYERIFTNDLYISARDLASTFFTDYLFGTVSRDPGFDLFVVKPVQLFTSDFRVFLFVVALFFMGCFAWFVYRNSANPLISFLIFSTFFYDMLLFNQMKQGFAVALAVFVGFDFIKDRRRAAFTALCLFASTIHISVLLFLPAFDLYKTAPSNKLVGFAIVCSIVLMAASPTLLSLTNALFQRGTFESALGSSSWLVFLMCSVAALLFLPFRSRLGSEGKGYITLLFIAMVISSLSIVFADALRLTYCYFVFLVLLLPCAIELYRGSERTLFSLGAFCALIMILLFVTPRIADTNHAYQFFWETSERIDHVSSS